METDMLNIYEDSIIYVIAPLNAQTGGPEAIHQLVDRLILLGHEAYIVYYDYNTNFHNIQLPNDWYKSLVTADVPNNYRQYNIKQTSIIIDHPHNIVIVPEIYPNLLSGFVYSQKVIWWLAVPSTNIYRTFNINTVTHFYQSEYAKNFLIINGVNELYKVSDYTNKIYTSNFATKIKQDIVLFNPNKGFHITQEILKFNKNNIQFVPLINMSPIEIKSLMSQAKVYIDFGHHPGKDRIPREAAISGCCIIVGKMGSAGFFTDVPIDNKYKFEIENLEYSTLINTIENCLVDYNKFLDDFQIYRNTILMEEAMFNIEIKRIFNSINK